LIHFYKRISEPISTNFALKVRNGFEGGCGHQQGAAWHHEVQDEGAEEHGGTVQKGQG